MNNVPLVQDSHGQVYTYNAYGQVPVNYTPRTYSLSDLAIKNSDHYFSKYDVNRSDSLSVNEIAPALREIFASEGQPPPENFDIAFLLNKYDINNDGRISHREFKRLLRELSGKRKYDKSAFRLFKKPPKSTYYAVPVSHGGNYYQQDVKLVPTQGIQTGSYNQSIPNTNVQNNFAGNSVFGSVPQNYAPLTYSLSKEGFKKAEHFFKQADYNNDGYVQLNQISPVFRAVFESDGKPVPQNADLAFLMNKYNFNNAQEINFPQFKRILKELNGEKSFDNTTINNYRYQNYSGPLPGQPGYVAPATISNLAMNQNPQANNLFAPIPQGYVPKAYALSKTAIRDSKTVFKNFDVGNKGYITINDLSPAIREVFAIDHHAPPQDIDVAALLRKFDLNGGNQVSRKQFRRLLKELSGTKAYDLNSFNFVKKIFGNK